MSFLIIQQNLFKYNKENLKELIITNICCTRDWLSKVKDLQKKKIFLLK